MALRMRFVEIAENIRNSYWLIPGAMALASLSAGSGMVLLDFSLGDTWLGPFERFLGSRPEGARAILTTIASSTITVAGVVFSVTLAAVTYASGQHGPRLLTNFQRDRGNQATLGTFIATFLYCLVVLRAIRSAEGGGTDTQAAAETAAGAFVPQLAIYGALALALASIAMLIYFVHHVTDSIHINNVVARIGQALIGDIRKLSGREQAQTEADFPELENPAQIKAMKTGYIEAVDLDVLVKLACKHDMAVRLSKRPGDFVHVGEVLLEASPAEAVCTPVPEKCNAAFAFGVKRTPVQDLRFAIDELVEIATRALSPGVNDPFTAIACIDWLGAAIAELQRLSSRRCNILHGSDGRPRVLFEALCFEDYLIAAFSQLRPYAAADPNARARMLQTLDSIIANAPAEHRRALFAERRRLTNDHESRDRD